MERSPLDEEIFWLYQQIRGGGVYKAHGDDDWIIRVCGSYVDKFLQNIELMTMLAEAMIRARYFEKAEECINRMQLEDDREYLRKASSVFLE